MTGSRLDRQITVTADDTDPHASSINISGVQVGPSLGWDDAVNVRRWLLSGGWHDLASVASHVGPQQADRFVVYDADSKRAVRLPGEQWGRVVLEVAAQDGDLDPVPVGPVVLLQHARTCAGWASQTWEAVAKIDATR